MEEQIFNSLQFAATRPAVCFQVGRVCNGGFAAHGLQQFARGGPGHFHLL